MIHAGNAFGFSHMTKEKCLMRSIKKAKKKVGEVGMKLFKKRKRKHYNLKAELAKWVEENIGAEYIGEALEKYDKITSGIPIGGMAETVAFVSMVETVQAKVEGR